MRQSEMQEVQMSGLRHLLPDRWWEQAAGLYLCTFKPGRGYPRVLSLDQEKAAEALAGIHAQGFRPSRSSPLRRAASATRVWT